MAIIFPDPSQSPWTGPNEVEYTWNPGGYWEAAADGGGGIDDAPDDGLLYVRKDGGWKAVQGGAAAWGFILPDGTLGDGINCTTQSLGGGSYLITFIKAMQDDKYSVVATQQTTNNVGDVSYTSNKATNSFRITCRNRDNGNGTNPAEGVSFAVFESDS